MNKAPPGDPSPGMHRAGALRSPGWDRCLPGLTSQIEAGLSFRVPVAESRNCCEFIEGFGRVAEEKLTTCFSSCSRSQEQNAPLRARSGMPGTGQRAFREGYTAQGLNVNVIQEERN